MTATLLLALLVLWLVYFLVLVLGRARCKRRQRRELVDGLDGLAQIQGTPALDLRGRPAPRPARRRRDRQ